MVLMPLRYQIRDIYIFMVWVVIKITQKQNVYLNKSLKLGNKMAAEKYLLNYFKKGLGVDIDLKKAFELLKVAEETQDLDVFYSLGLCYVLGRGVEEDQAAEYFKKAALKGHVVACLNYVLYSIRMGIESKNLNSEIISQAYQLLKLPYEAGYSRAIFLTIMIRLLCNTNNSAENQSALLILNQAHKVNPLLQRQLLLRY